MKVTTRARTGKGNSKLCTIVKAKQPQSKATIKAVIKHNHLAGIHQKGQIAKQPGGKNVKPSILLPANTTQQLPIQQSKNDAGLDESHCSSMYKLVAAADAASGRNPQLVGCYASEIFAHLRSLEPSQPVPPDHLRRPARLEVTPPMRSVLFNWLVQVHQRFALQPETLYLAFHIVDYCTAAGRDEEGGGTPKSEYQLLGISAMFLAAKYEEVCPPEIVDFVYLSDDAYTERQIRSTERRILRRLDYFLGYPLPVQYLRRYGHACCSTQPEHEMAKYLAELAACAYGLAHLPPSGKAAAAACLARRLLRSRTGNRLATASAPSAASLEAASGYPPWALRPAVRELARLALMAGDAQGGFGAAVYNKYSGKQHSCISTWPEIDRSSPILLALAEGDFDCELLIDKDY